MSTLVPVPLNNQHFDQGFYQYQGIGELTVARGWVPWWIQGTDEQVAKGFLKRPEYKPETERTDHGHKWFTTFATHDAGIYQIVPIPANTVALHLVAEAQYLSLHTDGSGGGMACRAGINVAGEDDPEGDYTFWGEWRGQDDGDWDGDTWKPVACSVDGEFAESVVLFLRSACRHRAKHNDSYWRSVTLEAYVEQAGPGPEPPPPGDHSLLDLAARAAFLSAEAAITSRQILTQLQAIDTFIDGGES